jgi:hypothetical protein
MNENLMNDREKTNQQVQYQSQKMNKGKSCLFDLILKNYKKKKTKEQETTILKNC